LPEGQAYPRIHAALDGVLTAIESAPSARGWVTALVRFERLMLSELGFGAGAGFAPLRTRRTGRRSARRCARTGIISAATCWSSGAPGCSPRASG
jgi:hypothetical protein